MINTMAVHAISCYQRYISPYKGFRCAYRVYTGKCSCSEYAKRIVAKRGAWALLKAMPKQFSRCQSSYAMLLAAPTTQTGNQNRNRRSRNRDKKFDCSPLGVCECGGDLPCDVGPCDCSL